MKVLACHNKRCGYRKPVNHMVYRHGQYFCTDRCANGCNPPENDKKVATGALSKPLLQQSFHF